MSAERKVFGKLQGMASPMPDLIDIQVKAYQDFLQSDIAPQKREDKGLQAIFADLFLLALGLLFFAESLFDFGN